MLLGEKNEINNCNNKGLITLRCDSTGNMYGGGIVAYASDDSVRKLVLKIENCYNTGEVTTSGNTNGYVCIGGIIGRESTYGDVKISFCYNTGNVIDNTSRS